MRLADPKSRAAFISSPISQADATSLSSLQVAHYRIDDIIERYDDLINDPACYLSGIGLADRVALYHPGSFEELLFPDSAEDSEFNFCQRQRATFVRYLEFLLAKYCRLIDDPDQQRKWSNKLVQLSVFKACGISVPNTTSRSKMDHRADYVMKVISESRAISPDTSFYCQPFNQDIFSGGGGTSTVPFMVQERLDFAEEYRTYMIGNDFVCISLARPLGVQAIDVHEFLDEIEATPHVPSSVELRIFEKLQEITGLKIFSIDYCIKDGAPCILEINPLTSWSWLPEPLQTQVTEKYSKLLGEC